MISVTVLVLIILLAFTSVGVNLWGLRIPGLVAVLMGRDRAQDQQRRPDADPVAVPDRRAPVRSGRGRPRHLRGRHARRAAVDHGDGDRGRGRDDHRRRDRRDSPATSASGVDNVLMRFTDVIITIPLIVIGSVLGNAFGSLGAAVLGVVIGMFAWTTMARLVRGEFLTLREREFVDAARVSGARDRRIIFRHILPNAVGVIVVNATLLMAARDPARVGAELPRLRRAVARHVARQDRARTTRRRSRPARGCSGGPASSSS